MMKSYTDIDGNFVEQFQTTAFDARLWELYLYGYFREEAFIIERPNPAPDFLLQSGTQKIFIEAVTVNPSPGDPIPGPIVGMPNLRGSEEKEELLSSKMPIKFGSTLYSKLSRKNKYWELPHVKGFPFVFAIADFHENQSMVWSSSALYKYLYGVSHDFYYDESGELIISPLKIETHEFNGKIIPSGFFFQPDAENVSAILTSSSGTISKFNRMGFLAGFGRDEVIKIIYFGERHDHDPNASLPLKFVIDISEDEYTENWADGISMFHNPNAIHPIDEELFPQIAHHKFVNGQIVSSIPDFFPHSSMTIVLSQEASKK